MNDFIEYEKMSGAELLEFISCMKDEYPEESNKSFVAFCNKYEKDLLQKSEIRCYKFGYNNVIALEAAQCTFARVWKYPTFDAKKSRAKDIDTGIKLWLYRILETQILLFASHDTCVEPTREEDLSLVTDVDNLIDMVVGNNIENKKELNERLLFLDNVFKGLSEKHKIIWLTYKAYETMSPSKNIPRSVSNMLKERLELTQSSIRQYKMEANNHIKRYIDNYGNR